MTLLTLSRAARLAGVTRAELQKRIRRGEITTFEGAIAAHDLLRLYPTVSLTDDAALERVEHIKSQALPKTEGDGTALPTPQVLLSRLHGLSVTLAERIARLDAAQGLLTEVEHWFATLASLPVEQLPDAVRADHARFVAARQALHADAAVDAQARLLAKDSFLRIIAANVKLIPSGHDFFVEGNESILDAAVRAGVTLGYGCSSGNCGDCKARLVSGETWKLRDHDYVISARERDMGYLLTCSHTAVTDLVIEAAEALTVDDLPQQDLRGSLRKIERLSDQLLALQVQTPRTQTLRFMAGQSVRLELENGASRELPIASCPCNGRNLWFYLRRAEDAFADALFGTLRSGQSVRIQGPMGRFVLVEEAPEPAIFIAVGDGIAPIKSLIEHAVSIDVIESFHLYWDSLHPEGHHQAHWCRALQDALDDFTFTPLTQGDPVALVERLQTDHQDWSGMRYYIAGPAAATQAIGELLQMRGVLPERIARGITES